MKKAEWEKIAGPESGNGLYTDRLKVPGGFLYRETNYETGGWEGKLTHVALAFAPNAIGRKAE